MKSEKKVRQKIVQLNKKRAKLEKQLINYPPGGVKHKVIEFKIHNTWGQLLALTWWLTD